MVRRACGLLLVLLFSLPLIAPAFTSAPDEASLPACCRRNGKHHCVMYRMMMGEVASRATTVSEKCPYSPFGHVALMLPHVFVSHSTPAVSSSPTGPAAIVREAEAGYRIALDRARHKRGPPRILAL
jgi:hypothetical protein